MLPCLWTGRAADYCSDPRGAWGRKGGGAANGGKRLASLLTDRPTLRGSLRVIVICGIVLAALSLQGRPAAANPGDFPACVGPATNCVQAFTVNGVAAPAGVDLSVFIAGGFLQVQLHRTGVFDLTQYELTSVPAIAGNTVVIAVRLDNTWTPEILIGTGLSSWSWNAGSRVLTITGTPSTAAWSTLGCTPGSCPLQATNDYAAMMLFGGASTAFFAGGFGADYQGSGISTNAQAFTYPTLDPITQNITFQLVAPHLKAAGPPNTGFFRALIPDAVVINEWKVADPTSLTAASLAVQINGTPATFTVTHVPAAGGSPAGLVIESSSFGYSTETVSIGLAALPVRPTLGTPGFGIRDLAAYNAARVAGGVSPLSDDQAAPYLVRTFDQDGKTYSTMPGESIDSARARVIANRQLR